MPGWRALAMLWLGAASPAFAVDETASGAPASLAPSGSIRREAPPAQEHNATSLFAATALGRGHAGFGMYLGFPLLGIRVGYGILNAIDVGLSFDSYYGVMIELRALGRWQLYRGRHWTWAVVAEGG